MKKLFCLFLGIPLLLISCASQVVTAVAPTATAKPPVADEAQLVLIMFFDRLNAKEYAAADALYGGDYEQLKVFSADVDPADHAKLWANACELAGLQCLKLRTITLKSQTENTFTFQVEFSNSEGNLFVLGPCCGSNETEMPPVSQFEYTVTRSNDGKFFVMDLPPYVP